MLGYLKGNVKLKALPTELQNSAKSLNNEMLQIKEKFANLLPQGDLKNFMLNNLKTYKNMIFNTLSNRLNQLRELVKLKSHHIQQINPKNILKKGYAIIRDKQDKIIKNLENAKHHKSFTIEMIDGRIEVERKRKKGLL